MPLGRGLRALGSDSFAEYRRFLEKSDSPGSEMALMINCMTTNKTPVRRMVVRILASHVDAKVLAPAGEAIYRETQARPFERLVQSLAPAGLLSTGHAEALFRLDDRPLPLDHSVYRLP